MLRVAKNCRGLLREKPQKRVAVIVVLRKSWLGEAKKRVNAKQEMPEKGSYSFPASRGNVC